VNAPNGELQISVGLSEVGTLDETFGQCHMFEDVVEIAALVDVADGVLVDDAESL
jgi:hypothetical protein